MTEEAGQAINCAKSGGGVSVAGTGHRPQRLGISYSAEHRRLLTDFVRPHLCDLAPDLVISGVALGFDQALAEAAVCLGVPFWAAVPFVGHESRWPAEARKAYTSLLDKAERVIVVSSGLYSPSKFVVRDQFMIRCANQVVAMYDGAPSGGTFVTTQFAKSLLVPIKNLFEYWAPPV